MSGWGVDCGEDKEFRGSKPPLKLFTQPLFQIVPSPLIPETLAPLGSSDNDPENGDGSMILNNSSSGGSTV